LLAAIAHWLLFFVPQAIFKKFANPSGFNLQIAQRGYPTLASGFDGQTAIGSFAGVLFFYIAIMSQFVVILGNVVYAEGCIWNSHKKSGGDNLNPPP
jgi:hypothetical protein